MFHCFGDDANAQGRGRRRVSGGNVVVERWRTVLGAEGSYTTRVTGLFRFQGVQRIPLPEARSGDIIALAGLDKVTIGDTLTVPDSASLSPTNIPLAARGILALAKSA